MKALHLLEINQPLSYESNLIPIPKPGEALVALHAAALNHRDVYITKGQYAGIKTPVILGSDGAGDHRGQAVVICPSLNWGKHGLHQGDDFQIVGMPGNGTFAGFVAVPKANLHPKPEHLRWEEAAALPLAGLTAWRVLFSRCQLKRGEKVLITGIGGGVALLAMQFALAVGAEVWVTSGTDEKLDQARALGASGSANYRTEGWDKSLKQSAGGFNVIIDSAGGDGFSALPGLCLPGARIGIYGGSAGKITHLSPQILFWKQISLLGSTMGSNAEFRKMLQFVAQHQIHPVIDRVFPLEQGNEALAHLERGDQFGKVVLKIQ
ncbi:MAG: zinc-binding dehydrogenase [Lewinellaceae bacterium]|nr:zinc-binding dehydrogenase [Lewinellaceae bacterium]